MEDYKEKYEMALNKAKTLLSKCKRVSDKASMIYRVEDIESMFPELKESDDEQIRKVLIELVKCNERSGHTLLNNISTSSIINWLEKQEQSKKTSIWKHWKNGICRNGEGKLVFLIKSGATYSLSSCLSFECDYIELSELENLILEKQNKQNSNILWHDISEEPEEQREIFCEWKGYIDAWHDVAFYHAKTKSFWNGEHEIKDVIKWIYIDEMIEEQPQLYFKPKFKVGDWITCPAFIPESPLLHVINIENGLYELEDIYGTKKRSTIGHVESIYYPWTYKDAKEGDVLYYKDFDCVRIYIHKFGKHYYYCCLVNNVLVPHSDYFVVPNDNLSRIRPATKEQRDTLFEKMKLEGYRWDEDKKELINIL